MRLNELAAIKADDINWSDAVITIWGKGNKQRKAPFTNRTAILLKSWLTNHNPGDNVWGINRNGIKKMIKQLKWRADIKCIAHSFRRGFTCNLYRKGLSTLDIMHLGSWQDLSIVLR